MNTRVGVLLAAAGSGTRFGGDKLFFSVAGKPLLRYTVEAFSAAQTVSEIVIVTRTNCLKKVQTLTEDLPKVIAVTEGGTTRQESVQKGIQRFSPEVNWFSIHDGARPLITPREIDRIHREAFQHGPVCTARPLHDTIQQVDANGQITATIDRNTLVAAVTPQIFPREIYLSAAAKTEGKSFTDDAGMVRAAGFPVHTILCRDENRKITTPEDGAYAAWLLSRTNPSQENE